MAPARSPNHQSIQLDAATLEQQYPDLEEMGDFGAGSVARETLGPRPPLAEQLQVKAYDAAFSQLFDQTYKLRKRDYLFREIDRLTAQWQTYKCMWNRRVEELDELILTKEARARGESVTTRDMICPHCAKEGRSVIMDDKEMKGIMASNKARRAFYVHGIRLN